MRDIRNKKIAVLTDTLKKAEKFMEITKTTNATTANYRFDSCKTDLCMNIEEDHSYYANTKWYKEHGFKIITFEEFMEEEDMIEAVEQLSVKKPKIRIKVKGTTTIATMKQDGKIIKQSEARLHPLDKYDYQTGVEIAMERLLGKEVNQDISSVSTKDLLAEINRRIEA